MRKPRAFRPTADELETRKVLSTVGVTARAGQLAAFHPTLQLNTPFARTLQMPIAGGLTASGTFSRTAATPRAFGSNALFAGRLGPGGGALANNINGITNQLANNIGGVTNQLANGVNNAGNNTANGALNNPNFTAVTTGVTNSQATGGNGVALRGQGALPGTLGNGGIIGLSFTNNFSRTAGVSALGTRA